MAIIRFPWFSTPANNEKTLTQLGFPAKTRLLIIHADDMGLTESTNQACIQAMQAGLVTSSSIMTTCQAAESAIATAQANPNLDFGIHLTLTSEWENYRWGPLLANRVPSLTDEHGFLPQDRKEIARKAISSEIEQELKSQIEFAIQRGLSPSHLDCHMYCCFQNPNLLETYIQLGNAYNIPVLLNTNRIRKWFKYNPDSVIPEQALTIDAMHTPNSREIRGGLKNYYRKALQNLPFGLNYLPIHPSLNDQEMQTITHGSKNYNADWRQADFEFFTSDECRELIRKNDIQLVTWKEMALRQSQNTYK